MLKSVLIIGYGSVTKHLIPMILAKGWEVKIVSRRVAEPTEKAIEIFPFTAEGIAKGISQTTQAISTVPPQESADPVLKSRFLHHLDLLSTDTRPTYSWIYLSATNVYGNHDGQWVDETSHCHPKTPSGIARLHVENMWKKAMIKQQWGLTIFRIAGIYGPKRSSIKKLKDGDFKTIVKKNHTFSRIHITDLCRAICCILEKNYKLHAMDPKRRTSNIEIYNIADQCPAALHIVDQYAAHLLKIDNLKKVEWTDPSIAPRMQEFFQDHKKVSSKKIRHNLGFSWKFPSYTEGIDFEYEHFSE